MVTAYLIDDAVTAASEERLLVLEIRRTDGSVVYRQPSYASAREAETPKGMA